MPYSYYKIWKQIGDVHARGLAGGICGKGCHPSQGYGNVGTGF